MNKSEEQMSKVKITSKGHGQNSSVEINGAPVVSDKVVIEILPRDFVKINVSLIDNGLMEFYGTSPEGAQLLSIVDRMDIENFTFLMKAASMDRSPIVAELLGAMKEYRDDHK